MKYNKSLRLLSILSAVCLCLTCFSAGSYATETKNGAAAIVETAVAQIGNYGGYKFKKDMNYYGPWCCCFVSWCARATNVPQETIPTNFSCTAMRNYFRNKGLYRTAKAFGGNYIPKPGDLVFFSNARHPENLSHIGIVRSADAYNVYCIEGNCSNQVMQVRRPYSSYVVGFATPEYSDVTVTPSAPAEPLETGSYKLNGNMNFRSAPSTSASTLIDGLIPEGTVVNVTEVKSEGFRNWGKITYAELTGWVCLDYSTFLEEAEAPDEVLPEEENTSDEKTPGVYKIINATNFRKELSASSQILDTLMPGTQFTVTQVKDGWGKASYNGLEGWICLNWSKMILRLGDVDSDGKITSADARITLRASVGLEELDENQNIAANYENGEKITASSARSILRVSVGLE